MSNEDEKTPEQIARANGWTSFEDSEDENLLVVSHDDRPVHFTGIYAWSEACEWDLQHNTDARLQSSQASPTVEQLAQRLRDIATGARSKASLIASGSPTSVYTKPVDVLRAIAKEAEDGLAPDPDKGLEIQRTLMLSTAHLPDLYLRWLNAQDRVNEGVLWEVPPTVIATDDAQTSSLIVDPVGEYGWRVCITDSVDEFSARVPADDPLLALLRFAEAHNCDWLGIDRDGSIVPGLPIFEDDE